MLKSLMDRFIKQSVMSDINTAAKLVKVDLTKEENYRDYSKIDVGFSTENELKKLSSSKKLTDRQVMEFRMQCKSWLKATVQKLCHKTAVQYQLARNLQFLDPRNIGDKDLNRTRLKAVLQLLVHSNRVSESAVDEILREHSVYVDDMVTSKSDSFRNFNPSHTRLDTFMYDTMANNDSYSKLWKIVRMLLVLSHGQASVERGFSVNRQTEVENMHEETFVARRLIYDCVTHAGGIQNIDVSNKQLLLSVGAARQKYFAYLEEQKKKKDTDKVDKKRMGEIEELKQKKTAVA